MGSTTVATYLPESMLIGIGPDLRILDENGAAIPFPSATTFAWFFHEYAHYLHNISTASGIAAFINTLELWRCFRLTIDEGGNRRGSEHFDIVQSKHLRDLTAYLDSARRKNVPPLKKLTNVESVKVQSLKRSDDITAAQGTLLSVVECKTEVTDKGGQTEALTAKVGTLELLEGAAWLLEKKMAAALNPHEDIDPPPVFPYMIAQAAAECAVPGIDDEGALACILAALQSSDAPGGFGDLLSLAQNDGLRPSAAAAFFRGQAGSAIAQNKAELEAQLTDLENEFANDGTMAKALRHIIGTARQGFAERERNPFFELGMIADVKSRTLTADKMLGQLLPCAVLQKNPGPEDKLQRDLLLSFHPATNSAGDDIESLLRVVGCLFHYVGVHRVASGFVNTKQAERRACPFYTCCNLALRQDDRAVCGQSPWQAADWSGWDQKGLCWYGTAVRITRPPRD